MKIFVSLSVRTSPLKEQQTILANAKDDLAKATRNQTAAREKLNNATKLELNVPAARKNYQRATNSRKLKQDTMRVQQQKVQRAAVVDRLVQEWNRLDKLKGTEQDNDQAKKRRTELSKLITEARRALRAIKVKKIVGKVPKVD